MNKYDEYWSAHALRVGHERAVTDLSIDHYQQHFTQLFDEIAPDDVRRMLDYGCGAGLLVPIVEDRWIAAYEGADISQELITYCRKVYPWVRFYHLPEDPPQGQYDFVTCHSVFTHVSIEDAESIMDELYLLLTDDGMASVSILTQTDSDWHGNVTRMDINKDYFKGLLEKHGFKIGKEVNRYQQYFQLTK
jgi:trans-aconitate methyltransferase